MVTDRVEKISELEGDHLKYFMDTALPKIVKAVTKQKWIDEEKSQSVNIFLQLLLKQAIVPFIQSDTIESSMISTLFPILDNDSNFYLSTGKSFRPPSDENVAIFPSETNRWASHYLVDNINLFSSQGGFENIFKLLKKQIVGLNKIAKILELFYCVNDNFFFPTIVSQTIFLNSTKQRSSLMDTW